MVEPFGCVVMLHWRLHVYGGPVPLPTTPSGPSSLFYSPLSHALCASLHPPLWFRCIPWPVSYPFDNPLKRNVIIGPCVIIVFPPFGNYIILTAVNVTTTCFFIFYAAIVRQYDRRLLKWPHQIRERRNRKSIVGDSLVTSRTEVTVFDGPVIYRECEIFWSSMKCAFYHYILYISLIWIRIVVSEIISSDFI